MKSNTLRNKVFSGLIWKFAERMLAQGVSFAVSVVLARILTPNDYGLIAMVLVFISLADVFVNSGFSTSLIQKQDATEEDFSTIFWSSLFCSCIIYAILFFTAPLIANFYNEKSLILLIRIFSIRIPLSVYNSIQHAYVSNNMLFKKFFYSTFFGTVISGIVGIAMAYMGVGVWALVAQYFVNTIMDTIILAITVPWHPTLSFSKKSAKELMSYGTKILLADFSGNFFGQLRSLIIGKFYTSADLAFYNKGQQLPSLITTNISSTVMTVLFPALATEGENIVKIKEMTRKSTKVLTYLIFPLLIGLAAVAEPLVILLFTEKWIDCIVYVQLLCLSSAIGLLGTISLQTIKAIGRSDIVLMLEFVKKPIYLILLVVGVKINVTAIAITMVIYDVYGTIVNMFCLKKVLNYRFREQINDIFPAILITGVMYVCLLLVNINSNILSLCIKVVAGVIIYVLISILFKIDSFDYIKKTVFGLIKEKR